MKRSSLLRLAVRTTLPVLMGYVPLGVAFGFLATQGGHPWWYPVAMSVFIYSGATQFFILGLAASGMTLATAVIIVCLLNVRHLFYGISLLTRFAGARWAKPYLIFAMTDETFALLSSMNEPVEGDRIRLYVAISALDQFYWVVGTLIGALAGTAVPLAIAGLEFSLTALFVVLALQSTERIRSLAPLWVALGTTAIGRLALPPSAVLPVSIAAGTAVLLFILRGRDHA